MRNKVLFGLAIVLVATLPLAAAEFEVAMQVPDALSQGCAVQADAGVDVATLNEAMDTTIELEPVSLKELAEGFLIPAGNPGGGCGQSGYCNESRDCFWMRSQCPTGTFPGCFQSTGSSCEGYCACGWT